MGISDRCPQTLDRLYFKVLMLAPESTKFDSTLIVDLKFPNTADPEFLAKFKELINGFEAYLK